MRFQRALSVIGCGSLGFLALVIAGCGSSNNNNNTDSGIDTPSSPDVHADTGNTDVPKDTGPKPDVQPDLKIDKGPSDVPDTHGSICTGVAPAAPLISDFSMQNNSTFGLAPDPITGGTYVSMTSNLDPQDFTASNWHISGPVVGHTDFVGIYWNCTAAVSTGCTLDVSQWAGIQFTIKGNVGPDNAIGFTMGRAEDDVESANANCGTCVAPADAATTEDACHGPRTTVTVPSDGSAKTVMLRWSDLTGGSPQASIDPHQLTGILWFFHDPPAASTDGGTTSPDGGTDGSVDAPSDGSSSSTYHVDFTIDDIKFFPF
jgi:hypothetical protein